MNADLTTIARLRAAGCVFAEDEARVLCGSARTRQELDAMVERRAGGEPLEQVVGWAEFCGLRVRVDPGVFVPRRRSESLVSVAVDLLRSRDAAVMPVVVDLCCGTGALGLAVAVELGRAGRSSGGKEPNGGTSPTTAPGTATPRTTAQGTTAPGTAAPGTTAPGTTAPGTTAPGTTAPGTTAPGTAASLAATSFAAAELHAADLDPAAVACARRNVSPAGGHVYQGDLFYALPVSLRERIDVLICNAPYVPTAEIAFMPAEAREHEARMALDGGADGLAILRKVVAHAGAWLAPGGVLLVETSERQASSMAAAISAAGLSALVHEDDETGATVVTGVSMPLN